MAPQILARLRQLTPGCSLAMWSDLTSGTVLAGDGDLQYPQEHLDALATCAIRLLSVQGPDDGGPVDQAAVFSATGSYAFYRVPNTTEEALCFLCQPTQDPEGLTAKLRDAIADGFKDVECTA